MLFLKNALEWIKPLMHNPRLNLKKIRDILPLIANGYNSNFSEPVSEPGPYRTRTKVKGQNSQKLLGRNLKCLYIFYRTDLAL